MLYEVWILTLYKYWHKTLQGVQRDCSLKTVPLVWRPSWIQTLESGRRLCRERSSPPQATLQHRSRWTSPMSSGPVYSWTNGLRCQCSWRSSPSMWAFSCGQTSWADGGQGGLKPKQNSIGVSKMRPMPYITTAANLYFCFNNVSKWSFEMIKSHIGFFKINYLSYDWWMTSCFRQKSSYKPKTLPAQCQS